MRQSLSLSRRPAGLRGLQGSLLLSLAFSMQFDLVNPDKITRVPLTTDGGSKAGRSRANLSSIDGRGIVEAYTKPDCCLILVIRHRQVAHEQISVLIDGRSTGKAYTKPRLLLDFGNSPPTNGHTHQFGWPARSIRGRELDRMSAGTL